MRLSDAFEKEGGCLECEARLLNINYGRNCEIMEKCRRLEENAIFVATVREYKKDDVGLVDAITQAIDECIEKGILVDLLTKQRSEVLEVVLTTFNQELYEKNLKQDAYEDGKQDGISEGIGIGEYNKLKELVSKKLQKGQSAERIADDLEESLEEIEKIVKELS